MCAAQLMVRTSISNSTHKVVNKLEETNISGGVPLSRQSPQRANGRNCETLTNWADNNNPFLLLKRKGSFKSADWNQDYNLDL